MKNKWPISFAAFWRSELTTSFRVNAAFKICVLTILGFNQNCSAVLNEPTQIAIDTSIITLSGLSAGGYMANQFHLSHPELVSGVGIIAAGPYGCARNSIITALAQCVNKAPETYPPNIADISEQFAGVSEFLRNDKVWLLHGTLDTRINASVANTLYVQYSQIIDAENLDYINDKPFSHLFPKLNTGVNCEISESPFIGNCGYDAAGELLNFIADPLKPRATKEEAASDGDLIKFAQAELANIEGAGMHKYGYVYVPKSCEGNNSQQACSLHLSFHGCNQSIDNIDAQYAQNTGINEWAVTNNMVVLYPQVAKSSIAPMHPQACWDWWGYTGENYSNKDAKQIHAVKTMVMGLQNYLNLQNKNSAL